MSLRTRILTALTFFGFAVIVFGRLFEDDYWQGVAVEVGAGLALFAALLYLERDVLLRTRAVASQVAQEAVAPVIEEVSSIQKEVAEAKIALADLSARSLAISSDQADQLRRSMSEFEEFATFDNLWRIMEFADGLNAISSDGCRVRLSGGAYLRFRRRESGILKAFAKQVGQVDNLRSISIQFESVAGEEIDTIDWSAAMPVKSLPADVAGLLQRNGAYTAAFDLGETLGRLARSLQLAAECRIGHRPPSDLDPLIEVVDEVWAITEYGLEHLGKPGYWIERDRVHDEDWPKQMSAKNWVDMDPFMQALSVARALFPNSDFLPDDTPF